MHQILPINVSQRAAALHDFTLFSDPCMENIHFLRISTICKTNTEITFTKQVTTTWKRTQKNFCDYDDVDDDDGNDNDDDEDDINNDDDVKGGRGRVVWDAGGWQISSWIIFYPLLVGMLINKYDDEGNDRGIVMTIYCILVLCSLLGMMMIDWWIRQWWVDNCELRKVEESSEKFTW